MDVEKLIGGMGRSNVVPFGKYRGQPLEVLRQDPEYVRWVLDNGVVSESKYRDVYVFLVGPTQGEGHSTPEHNRYQAMFLEELFAGDVFDELLPGEREQSVRRSRQWDVIEGNKAKYGHGPHWNVKLDEGDSAKVNAPVAFEELPEVEVKFEARGYHPYRYDRFGQPMQYGGSADVQLTCADRRLRIEIKPSMGDDYPAVLRQMKASECNVLYLVEYNGTGATLDQVRKMFKASGVEIMEHAE